LSKASEIWELDLRAKSPNTRKTYRRGFKTFKERWDLSPEELYESRKRDMESDDPRDRHNIERKVKVLMAEMHEQGYAASTCRMVAKSVSSFLESQGMPLELKAKDMPKGLYNGQRLALAEHIREMWDFAATETKLKSRAILMFLKDSGIRISDAATLNMGDWTDARTVVVDNETFKVFDPRETKKTSAPAYIHVGPETVEAMEAYLNKRKTEGPLDASDPLFIDRNGNRAKSFTIGQTIYRLRKHSDTKKVSAHSLRKFHTTMLESAGVAENWIKKLEGKAVGGSMGPYSRPEESGELTQAYIKAYPKLRIFKDVLATQRIEEQAETIKKLQEELEQVRNGQNSEVAIIRTQIQKLQEKQTQDIETRKHDRELMELLLNVAKENPDLIDTLMRKKAQET